jgi:hypothetical protein
MSKQWMEVVSEVFDTNPRDGNRKETVWLPRTKLEKLVEDELYTRGRHICIDGCSGSGKSSLIITTLLKHKIPFTMVQITRTMTWQGLCRQLIQKPKRTEREKSLGISGEWKGLFPVVKLEIKLGQTSDEKITNENFEAIVERADQHQIAKAIAEQDCVVLLDDFERASQDLASQVSEVCKILSQTYTSRFGKLIILGADDVYKKLYDAYSTLDNRLVQISIPTLPTPWESWNYLQLGFSKLNKYHPGTSKYADRNDVKLAVQAIYCAADGLFKSLTELGINICREVGPETKGITLKLIQRVCKVTEERNFSKYQKRFAEIHRLAEKAPVAAAVLFNMNRKGLGQIHNLNEIIEDLSKYGKTLVKDAILALWKHDFLVMTGTNNEKLFIKNPSWAHTLRVYLSNPNKRKKLERHLEKPIQFALDLGIEWDKLETDGQFENANVLEIS